MTDKENYGKAMRKQVSLKNASMVFESDYFKNILLPLLSFAACLPYAQLPLPKQTEEKLKIFELYFGKYNQTMVYGGMKWSGTIEVKKIIKGWYVDLTILTKSEDSSIDREYHMIVTYDMVMN